ncbi:MAG: BatA and WFA domain-containing protein [Pirellulales bacterium]
MNWIEFANPLGWWWAALALPIIAFYILKVRLRRKQVSTFLFWDRVFEEKKPRAWWQQLRHWLSLLLQLLLLLLLVGALVDPLWSWQKSQRRKLILIVDNSASMGTVESSNATRLDAAKKTAAALARSLRAGDEMAVLSAGGKPAVVVGLTDHIRSLLEAIERVELTDAPTALAETVKTARRLLPEGSSSQITILTDGCDPSAASLAQDASLQFVGFGKKLDNVAITQFQVRRSLSDAIGYQVLIEVTNFSEQSQSCRLELDLEGRLADVIPIELAAGANKSLHLDQTSAAGGRLTATLDIQDALAVDNRALAVLPSRRKMPVSLVSSGSLFLNSVLQSIPLTEVTSLTSLPSPMPAGSQTIWLLHQQVPEKLPDGKLFVINPKNNCDQWTLGSELEQPIVAEIKSDSPITQHVRLTNVIFPGAVDMTFSGEYESLISAPESKPLLARIRRPQGDALVLNVNLDDGDLPLRIAFPVLMKNAIEWFSGVSAELEPAATTGSALAVELPKSLRTQATYAAPQASESTESTGEKLNAVSPETEQSRRQSLFVQDPAGTRTPLAEERERALIALVNKVGLWTIGTETDLAHDPWSSTKRDAKSNPTTATSDAPDGEAANEAANEAARLALEESLSRVAVNLCNREESDVRPRIDLPHGESLGMTWLGGWSIWFYLAATALALITVEWWLYQRRVVG